MLKSLRAGLFEQNFYGMFEHLRLALDLHSYSINRSPRKTAFIINASEAGSIVITLASGFTITILQ